MSPVGQPETLPALVLVSIFIDFRSIFMDFRWFLEYFEPPGSGCPGLKVLCHMLGLHVFKVPEPLRRLGDLHIGLDIASKMAKIDHFWAILMVFGWGFWASGPSDCPSGGSWALFLSGGAWIWCLQLHQGVEVLACDFLGFPWIYAKIVHFWSFLAYFRWFPWFQRSRQPASLARWLSYTVLSILL